MSLSDLRESIRYKWCLHCYFSWHFFIKISYILLITYLCANMCCFVIISMPTVKQKKLISNERPFNFKILIKNLYNLSILYMILQYTYIHIFVKNVYIYLIYVYFKNIKECGNVTYNVKYLFFLFFNKVDISFHMLVCDTHLLLSDKIKKILFSYHLIYLRDFSIYSSNFLNAILNS